MVPLRPRLSLALSAAALALAVLRSPPKARPDDEGEGEEEGNTHNLPSGAPIAAELRRWFREQARRVLGTIPTIGHTLPDRFEDLSTYDHPMAAAMTPLIGAYWQESGEKVLGRIGAEALDFDPDGKIRDGWQVTNPELAAKVRTASLTFCQATNATTSRQLDDALATLRAELHAGLVEHGESLRELTSRVKGVFEGAETWRARRIAATEASRAVHAAQVEAARQSGVVSAVRLLLSSDACPLCHAVKSKEPEGGWPLGATMHDDGKGGPYSSAPHPPLHPHCGCSLLEVIDEAALKGPDSEAEAEDEGPFVAEEIRPEPAAEPEPAKPPPPKPEPTGPGAPILPGRPMAERLAAYTEGDRKVGALAAHHDERRKVLDDYYTAKINLEDAVANLKKGDRRKRAVREELARREAAFKAAEVAFKAVPLDPREVLLGLAAPPRRAYLSSRPEGLTDPDLRRRHADGERFVRSLLAADPARPDEPIRLTYHQLAPDGRANAGGEDVRLAPHNSAAVVAHEIGHCLEDQLRGVVRAEKAFLEHRAAGEPLRELAELYPTYGYEKGERCRRDKFDQYFGDNHRAWYCGKDYPNRSELLSMGVEALYDDPAGFARKDPEYCKFILGLLDGSLRDP